jgi:hypothetical protein
MSPVSDSSHASGNFRCTLAAVTALLCCLCDMLRSWWWCQRAVRTSSSWLVRWWPGSWWRLARRDASAFVRQGAARLTVAGRCDGRGRALALQGAPLRPSVPLSLCPSVPPSLRPSIPLSMGRQHSLAPPLPHSLTPSLQLRGWHARPLARSLQGSDARSAVPCAGASGRVGLLRVHHTAARCGP